MTARVPADAQEPAEKKVSWAELFFDLVFVIAITRVLGFLERDHSTFR